MIQVQFSFQLTVLIIAVVGLSFFVLLLYIKIDMLEKERSITISKEAFDAIKDEILKEISKE